MTEAYKKLKGFLTKEMRMSHVYQPVMLRELMENGGKASVTDIARALLVNDESQIEYYELIVKNMVGRVLTKNRGITQKVEDAYLLTNYQRLTQEEIKELILLCDQKIRDFLEKRKDLWKYRKLASRVIPGTVRYEVLLRAKLRCELCGVSADVRRLEVDHIVPRSKKGDSDINNYQALCYLCNENKGNRDQSDLRGVDASYSSREEACVFCSPQRKILESNNLAYCIHDKYPVTELHTLIIPNRHVPTYFDLYQSEINAVNQLLEAMRQAITKKDGKVTGFNIGINAGVDAGQTIPHCHIHLIPRRSGDLPDPRGGVRGVIPNKRIYGD